MRTYFDFAVTIGALSVFGAIAYVSRDWPTHHAVALMVPAFLVVIAAVAQYLAVRDQIDPPDPPHVIADKVAKLSDGKAFEKDEQAREAMRQRLASFSGSTRGPARLERVK